MKQKTLLLFFFFNSIISFSQEITLKGNILDQQNRGIQSASVSLLDESEDILGYNLSDEEGEYSITFEKPKTGNVTIEISCLGYHKISKIISILPKEVHLHALKLKETENSYAEWYASDN